MKKTNDNPLYNFKNLKDFLIAHGYEVGESSPFTPYKEDLDFDQMTNLEFVPESEGGGIIIKDARGRKHIGFLFKRQYWHNWQGRIDDPRAHLCNCSTIQSFGRDEYRFDNSSPVSYHDKSSRSERHIEHLEVCQNCLNLLALYGHRYRNTEDYVNMMTERYGSVGKADEVDVDASGYTRDWQIVSSRYRREKEYKCEKCGYEPATPFDRRFIHVHHRNGDKIDNRAENLQCLCIRCHSLVDQVHLDNFMKGDNRRLLEEFLHLK